MGFTHLPKGLFFLLLVGQSFASLQAQMSLTHEEGNAAFRNALDLFEKEKFLPAQQYFVKTIEEIEDPNQEVYVDASYYRAICAIELFHENAEQLLREFIQDNPESIHRVSAYYNLAKFQFRKKRFRDVLNYLDEIDPLDLSETERVEYYFKRGYAYFEQEEFKSAAGQFYEIKDTDNRYVGAARYYYAHIMYQDKKYETAASNFKKIESDLQFGPLVPYYLTQIYYKQEKYQELLDYAPAVLDSAPPKRESEIRKLIGNSHYELGQFQAAIPFLEAYLKKNSASLEDYYQLGYSFFQVKKYESAIENLKKAIGVNDTLAQSAYYCIAESSIQLGEKNAAKEAFRNAYRLAIDKDLAEDALFNYAKVAYEAAAHPYDNAILAFEEYINKYPDSDKISDAYEYLLGVYYTTKNYKEALLSLDRIQDKDIKLLEAKQRIAHFRGVELFWEENYSEAIQLFRMSREQNFNSELYSASVFWMGEAFYRLGDYDNANDSYSTFLASSGAMSHSYYARAYYSLAYSNYKPKKYKSAIFWFREYIDNSKSEDKGLINDAHLRIADAYFIQKDYRNAIDYYDKAVLLEMPNRDYALFQSALSRGVLGDYKSKIEKLKLLNGLKMESVYADDALYELGKTSLVLDQSNEAISYYTELLNEHPESPYLSAAYLKLGLIQYNKEADQLALSYLDKVVKDFPKSIESKEALEKIRSIFIDNGDAEGFEQYINGVPFADISKSRLDSTSYVIAENNYLAGSCEKATRDFSNYLNRYPEGIFSLNAHYYRAECELKAGFMEEAAQDYAYVAKQASNKFSEKALLSLGATYFSLKELEKAEKAYQQLLGLASSQSNKRLAQRALMDLNFDLERYDQAQKYAAQVLAEDPLEKNLFQDANLIMAKSAFEQENYPLALAHLDTLVQFSSAKGAESKYMMARILYLQGDYDKSDTLVYAIVDQVPSSPYWIAKGFILLADNFISKGDYYNARITFQSVIDNADDTELVAIAKEKLEILIEAEELKETNETQPIEIIFDEENVKDNSIFDLEESKEKGGNDED